MPGNQLKEKIFTERLRSGTQKQTDIDTHKNRDKQS